MDCLWKQKEQCLFFREIRKNILSSAVKFYLVSDVFYAADLLGAAKELFEFAKTDLIKIYRDRESVYYKV